MNGTMNHQNRRALLIGIDEYARNYVSDLAGCVNDVVLMADILQNNFGFPEENITLVRNAEATRDGILAAMDALVDRAGEDDIVVVHYSGHGSQMTDREGDEPDGKDETIVPHDSGRRQDPNRDITDDEIYVWLLRLTEKTPYVTLVFDCCHSGTVSRDLFGEQARWVEPDERPIEALPPSPVAGILSAEEGASRDIGPSGWLPLGEKYVLIAGCHDEELSYEFRVTRDGSVVRHGALTYFLCQELVNAEPGSTYRDVFEQASIQVTAQQSRQHPQMEGARDRELFGVRDMTPTRFVSVRARIGNTITLGAGAAHGLTPGSQWAIYPAGTQQVTDATPRLGLIKITAVGTVSADGEILEESAATAIQAGTRAVEETHHYGEMRLVVDLQSPAGYETTAAELAELVDESPLLRRAESDETADVRAYMVAPRTVVGEGDPVPQLGAVAEATWAVVTDGRLAMPTHAVDEAGVAFTLRDNLEKMVRYRQALALRNPNASGRLRNKVELILKRQQPDSTWVVAEPDDASGLIVFEEGDRIAAQIVNYHNASIYVSVLDFGLTGAVSLLYPIAGASEQLAPGQSIEMGVRAGDELELVLPGDFPYVREPDGEVGPIGGTETFKLFATTQSADFSLLVQEGYRDIDLGTAEGAGTPLGQLLAMALTGHGRRDARRNQVPADAEWTTVERAFFLRHQVM